MRSLFPRPGPARPLDALDQEHRPPPGDRPWVMVNMITSLDGRTAAANGRSGPLGGPADRAMFRALRAMADIVLAGSGTVRAENYGPPTLPESLQATRVAAGRAPLPRAAVVSGSLQLTPDLRLFQGSAGGLPPLILTSEASLARHPDRALALGQVAHIIAAGRDTLDWRRAVHTLARDHATHILLVEGGPTVNNQLLAADLVDEVRLTLAPTLWGDTGAGLAGRPSLPEPRRFHLAAAAEDDDFLLLRYLRHPTTPSGEKSSRTPS